MTVLTLLPPRTRRRARLSRALTGLATRARLPELLLIAGRLSC